MSEHTQIIYREFYDVPRCFLVRFGEGYLLFESLFDDELDDYTPFYVVWLLPMLLETQLVGSWEHLSKSSLQKLGQVPVHQVQFDPTRRQSIDVGVFDRLPLK